MRMYFLATALILVLTGCKEAPQAQIKDVIRPAKIFEVVSHTGSDVREFPGRVAAADVSSLSFRISGEITALPVRDGEHVRQGQIIARLDERTARNDLKNAQTEFEVATLEHDRKKSLFDQGIISRSSYDRAYANFIGARTDLDNARDRLSYTILKAPFTGVISKVNAENHEVIQANQTIAVIQGEEVIELTISMPERIVANIRPEGELDGYQPAAVFSSAPEEQFLVRFKENAAEANSGSQTYDVTFVLDQPENLTLLPGMTATILIDIARITNLTESDSFNVPTRAVNRIDGLNETYVWVVESQTNTISKRSVDIGRITDGGVEILSGIQAGDRLVTAGFSELAEGMEVRPLSQERGI